MRCECCYVDDVAVVLRRLGICDLGDANVTHDNDMVVDEGDLQDLRQGFKGAQETASSTTMLPPRVVLLNGNEPAAQPMLGERMDEWRQRLAVELGIPCAHIALAGESQITPETLLDTIEPASGCPLTALIQPVALTKEHCVEAACALLNASADALLISQRGCKLLRVAMKALESQQGELSKRCQFIIMDLSEKVSSLDMKL